MEKTDKKHSLRSVLVWHGQQYPLMQVQDWVKLVYQNEFAGGHLITSETDSLKRLEDEARSLPPACQNQERPLPPDYQKQPPDNPLARFEPIGNGLCRMNLAGLAQTGIDLATVNRFFVLTAETVTGATAGISAGITAGSVSGFRDKLEILRQYLRDRTLTHLPEELDAFIQNYDYSSCPPVGHSPAYRKAYSPAYRIVRLAYCDYFAAFSRIDTLLRTRPMINVAIDGPCGSGKSTLADLLRQVYHCNVIPMDHFFLPAELRTAERLQEPGGNIDYDRFVREALPGLQSRQSFQYRMFDCSVMRLGPAVSVQPNRLNVIEGSYSLHPKFSDAYDLKIFLQISPDEQQRRIRSRESPKQFKRFAEEWIPLENRYFQEMKIMEQCDLVIGQPD